MAIVSDDPNLKTATDSSNDDLNKTKTLSSEAAPSGPAGFQKSSAAPGISGAPTSSGRFTNIQNYLTANNNYNKDGGGLAGQVGSDLSKQAGGLQSSLVDAQQNWVNANQSKNIDPAEASRYVNDAITNPEDFVKDSNNVAKFQNYENAQNNYVTPEAFDANQGIQNKVQQFGATTNLAQTEPGRYTLLNNMYGNPGYSQGQQKLDNLLLQGNSGQLSDLTNTTQALNQNLGTGYNNTANQLGTLAGQYVTNASTVQNATRDALGGVINKFGVDAEEAKKKAGIDREIAFQAAKGMYGTGQTTFDDMAKYGFTPETQLYGLDPSKFINPDNSNISIQNIITPEQQNRINALSQLAGTSLVGDPTQVMGQFNGNKAAGTFNPNAYNFDTAKFNDSTGKIQSLLNVFKGTGNYDRLIHPETFTGINPNDPVPGQIAYTPETNTPAALLDTFQKIYGPNGSDTAAYAGAPTTASQIATLRQLIDMGYDPSKYRTFKSSPILPSSSPSVTTKAPTDLS